MAMIVANNLNAIGIQRTLNSSNASLSGSLEKLSTGYKINAGKDDPSGLVISEFLRSQASGISRAIQNTQEANNVLGIAEGALNEMNNILSKMRQLAIHAANNGVTSSEQIAADQAEIDSSIQTLDRIARTTTYSGENLLNGNKEINWDSTVLIKDTKDMGMIDRGLTDIQQIFKRSGFQLNINFSGKDAQGSDNGQSAKKAFFEITKETAGAEATQMTGVGTGVNGVDSYTLTADQSFTLTGNMGSRTMSFAKGSHIGEMVSAINNVADSTGVKASLIFDSSVVAGGSTGAGRLSGNMQSAGAAADNTYRAFNWDAGGNILGGSTLGGNAAQTTGNAGVTSMTVDADITSGSGGGLQVGLNLDGNGRMYLRMITDDKFEIYKDAAMTMKVGSGDVPAAGAAQVNEQNNSGIGTNISITVDQNGFKAGSTSVLQFNAMAQETNSGTGATLKTDSINFNGLAGALGTFGGTNLNDSYFSGVNLGVNTSDTGQLYIKADLKASGGSDASMIWVYKDAKMRDEDLVAMSDAFDMAEINGGGGINIFAAPIGNTGQTTGLYGVINMDGTNFNADLLVSSAIVKFENLGVRISAADYGSDQFVKVNAHEGSLWTRYDSNNNAVLMSSGLTGTDWTNYGSDAVLSLNGQKVTLQGIKGTLTNLDTTANIAFKTGEIGNTTIATVGYDNGSIIAKAAQLGNRNGAQTDALALHALHSTTEIISNFTGGMQFQLGEGAGDQNRTIYGVKNMTATELGKTKFHDYFGNNFKTDKYLSMQDLMSGGLASLASDPIKSMSVINTAISGVSALRANIGAFQANMLQTNANSLEVAMENIIKTESYIRDTDMATESTKFTKNQVLVQAGTSMLAQANGLTQNALSLLR